MQRIKVVGNHLAEDPNLTPIFTSSEDVKEFYDYIIVGGGSAGCVIASRLSEDPEVSVLLIEAGGEDDILRVNTPGLYGTLQLSDVDWKFKSEPQKSMGGRVSFWPRGKVLGGCSSINAIFYVRGDKENFNNWERNGCTGWGYKDVLPYFKKSENVAVKHEIEEEYHGKGGPMNIVTPQNGTVWPYTRKWVEAGHNAGLPKNKDYNGSEMEGIFIGQCNARNGIRENTSRVFLRPHRNTRKNLTILKETYVYRILIQGNTAVGVEFKSGSKDMQVLRSKKPEIVKCRKEVIISAGAVNSPWLLMLSGIGPKEHLQSLNIPVVADLPVGKNLQDHLFLFHTFETKNQDTPTTNSISEAMKYFFQYFFFTQGPLTNVGIEGTAFTKTGLDKKNDAVDLQIHFLVGAPNQESVRQGNLTDNYWQTYQQKRPSYGIVQIPTLLQPKSIGYISLKSNDPFEYPIIEPNYFSDPEGYDLQVMVEGMKLTRKIAQHSPLSETLKGEILDESITHPPETEEYIREFVKKSAMTVYHPVGTCKMGSVSDPTTVVDPNLKVKGIKGLRVVDASVMPKIVSGNTNAASIMIGEKAADLIKLERRIHK